MIDNFYRALEERHRGSTKLIKERLSVYLPFVQPIVQIYPEGQVLDIGCGRGEWLALLRENNIAGYGIDLDEGMLHNCLQNDLKVLREDACNHLKDLPDESLLTICAFHVVEHLPFEQLQELVKEAQRVLKPGGLLIMETPNPENLMVGATEFYLDPTHVKPIPPLLLVFLTEYYGYKKIKLLRLNEPNHNIVPHVLNLSDVFRGVSPDYAVIGQKNADQSILSQTDTLFLKDYGLSIDAMMGAYDLMMLNMKNDIVRLNHQMYKLTQPYRMLNKLKYRFMQIFLALRQKCLGCNQDNIK